MNKSSIRTRFRLLGIVVFCLVGLILVVSLQEHKSSVTDPIKAQIRAVRTQTGKVHGNLPQVTANVNPSNSVGLPLPASAPLGDPTMVKPQRVGELRMIVAAESWQNAGLSTPSNALQTYFWAMRGGNMEALEGATILDESAELRVRAILGALTPQEREKFTSANQFAAFLLCGTSDERGYILTREERKGDKSNIVTLTSHPDGTGKLKGSTRQFQRLDDGTWRVIIMGRHIESVARSAGVSRK